MSVNVLILHSTGEILRDLLIADFPDVDFTALPVESAAKTLPADAERYLVEADVIISIGRWMDRRRSPGRHGSAGSNAC